MTSKFYIVRDSAIDTSLPDSEYVITVPVQIIVNDEAYLDTEVPKALYEDGLQHGRLTTSQPSPEQFSTIYERLQPSGLPILSIHIAHKLSGTYNSARIAAESKPNIVLFDTESASIGSGFLVELAAQCLDRGYDINKTVLVLEQARSMTDLMILVDNIDHLHRSGRINFMLKGVLQFFNLIPILTTKEGQIQRRHLVLGRQKAVKKIIQTVNQYPPEQFRVIIGGTKSLDKTDDFGSIIENYTSDLLYIGKALEIHVGLGAIGVIVGPKFDYLLEQLPQP